MKPITSKKIFSERIRRFAAQLAPNSVAIIVSNPEQTRSNDTEYPYRQSSDMLHLIGFPEAESALVLTNFGGKVQRTLFVQAKIPSQETWTGIRIGTEAALQRFVTDKVFTVDKFTDVVKKLVARADNIYYKLGHNDEFDKKFLPIWQENQKPLLNPETIVHEMRMFKGDDEIALIQAACDISASAHIAAMQRCQPGLFEYQLQATLENTFTEAGAPAPAYGSIVASGNNACVLHYTSNRDRIEDGQLVLIDAACEFEGYASDITRTFPANGKFTAAQREIYELVLKAQAAAIAKAKPGETLTSCHNAAAAVLRRGLVQLGILPREMGNVKRARQIISQAKKDGTEKDLITLGRFFMHGNGHPMGRDVHDVGERAMPGNKSKERKLEVGMVFTSEPGCYLNLNDAAVPERYRGIGIRIEDDVVITADGCRILTAAAPKTVDEIERLMAEAASNR